MAEKSLKMQRIKLLAILALFVIPVAVAWFWNANLDQWRPTATMNNGELIVPLRTLPAFELQSLETTPITLETLRGKWTLVYIGHLACTQACQNNLYKLRQTRLALNEKMDRVQRLWVIADAESGFTPPALLNDYPGMFVSVQSGASRDEFIAQFRDAVVADPATAEQIYIIDPLGNVMMRYPADADAKGILKDLRRLLLTSWVG